MAETTTRYVVRTHDADEPGVLAAVAAVFASHGVSVQTVDQSSAPSNDSERRAVLGMVTHLALEADLQSVVRELERQRFTSGSVSVLRVEGF